MVFSQNKIGDCYHTSRERFKLHYKSENWNFIRKISNFIAQELAKNHNLFSKCVFFMVLKSIFQDSITLFIIFFFSFFAKGFVIYSTYSSISNFIQ